MPEFRFHHLERRRVDQALADLLERTLAEGRRVAVQARSPEEVEALNERLWTYAEESFLPHGTRRDGEPETQPIYLTDGGDNLNRAAVRVLLSGVEAAPFAAEDYERVLLLFDGRDEEAKAEARRQFAAPAQAEWGWSWGDREVVGIRRSGWFVERRLQ